MRRLQLYATGAATTNSAASVTIPNRSRIRAIQVCATYAASVAADDGVWFDVSPTPVISQGVNGSQTPILQVALFCALTTSGIWQATINKTFPIDFEAEQGQLIYLNALQGVGSATWYFNGILWF